MRLAAHSTGPDSTICARGSISHMEPLIVPKLLQRGNNVVFLGQARDDRIDALVRHRTRDQRLHCARAPGIAPRAQPPARCRARDLATRAAWQTLIQERYRQGGRLQSQALVRAHPLRRGLRRPGLRTCSRAPICAETGPVAEPGGIRQEDTRLGSRRGIKIVPPRPDEDANHGGDAYGRHQLQSPCWR